MKFNLNFILKFTMFKHLLKFRGGWITPPHHLERPHLYDMYSFDYSSNSAQQKVFTRTVINVIRSKNKRTLNTSVPTIRFPARTRTAGRCSRCVGYQRVNTSLVRIHRG